MLKLATCFTENLKIIAVAKSALFRTTLTTKCLAAGFCPDPLGELTALPKPNHLAGLRGWTPGRERGGKGKKDIGREKKKRNEKKRGEKVPHNSI